MGRPFSCRSIAGPSALFSNSSYSAVAGPPPIPLPQIALTTLHAPHESHASHDSHNFHGTHTFPSSNIQHTVFLHIPYNNISPTWIYQSQFHYFHPSPHVAPVAPQVIPSPSKGRKRKSNAAGQGGGPKRQRVPAPVVPAPTPTICGVGPTIPVTSLLSDGDPPLSSSQPPCSHLPSHCRHHQHRANFLPPCIRPFGPTEKVRIQAQRVWYFC